MARDEWEAEHERQVAENLRAELLIISELRSQGCDVDSLVEVRVAPGDLPLFLRVVLQHLKTERAPNVRVMLAAPLTGIDISSAWDEVVGLFRAEPDRMAKELIARALAASVTEQRIKALVDLVSTTTDAGAQLMLLSVFAPFRGNPISRRRRLLPLVRSEVERHFDHPEIGHTLRDAVERIDRYESALEKRRAMRARPSAPR